MSTSTTAEKVSSTVSSILSSKASSTIFSLFDDKKIFFVLGFIIILICAIYTMLTQPQLVTLSWINIVGLLLILFYFLNKESTDFKDNIINFMFEDTDKLYLYLYYIGILLVLVSNIIILSTSNLRTPPIASIVGFLFIAVYFMDKEYPSTTTDAAATSTPVVSPSAAPAPGAAPVVPDAAPALAPTPTPVVPTPVVPTPVASDAAPSTPTQVVPVAAPAPVAASAPGI